jgi:hypothetical protein
MRITGGDLLVAVAGIGTVLLILLAVLLINSGEGPEEGDPEAQTAIVVEIA